MQVTAVDFVQYTVTDLDDAITFYRDRLGLTLESRLEDVGWAEFALPPTTLALWEPGADEAATPGGGGASVALAVDDVAAAVDELRDSVDVLVEPFDTGVCDTAVIADPNGNHLTLHRRHDGTHGRRDPLP